MYVQYIHITLKPSISRKTSSGAARAVSPETDPYSPPKASADGAGKERVRVPDVSCLHLCLYV